MSKSNNNKLIAFISIAIFVVAIWGIIPFYFLDSHGDIFSNLSHFSMDLGRFGSGPLFRMMPLLLLTLLWFGVCVWVYRDAEKRNMNGLLWALLAFIGNFIGLLIYLIVRSDSISRINGTTKTTPCPACQKPVQDPFAFCPHCGSQLKHICPKCGKDAQSDWQVCPHCGEKLSK